MNIAELKISEMNDLELRGALYLLIGKVKNRLQLEQITELIRPLIEENGADEADWWEELSAEQQADVTASIGETEDPTKWTTNEDVRKMSRQWLSA